MIRVPFRWRGQAGLVAWAGGADDPVVVSGVPADVAETARAWLEEPYELPSVHGPGQDGIERLRVAPRAKLGWWHYRLCGLAAEIRGTVLWEDVTGLP